MKASKLIQSVHYPNFPEFEEAGIDLDLTDADTILALQEIRKQAGVPIYPGRKQDNWGRLDGSKTSQHYAGCFPSLAGDVFPARGFAIRTWIGAQNVSNVKALGLYLDTNGQDGKPWIMMHYDLRRQPTRIFWIRFRGKYIYLHNESSLFWKYLGKVLEREEKIRRKFKIT